MAALFVTEPEQYSDFGVFLEIVNAFGCFYNFHILQDFRPFPAVLRLPHLAADFSAIGRQSVFRQSEKAVRDASSSVLFERGSNLG
jgi:hypothetical protein